MSELVVRVVLVVALAAAAGGIAVVARRLPRWRAERSSLDFSGIGDDGVILFTDPVCANCDEARQRLQEAGVAFREISYGNDPDRLRHIGVNAVPLVVVVSDGAELIRIAGVPSRRRLARLVAVGS